MHEVDGARRIIERDGRKTREEGERDLEKRLAWHTRKLLLEYIYIYRYEIAIYIDMKMVEDDFIPDGLTLEAMEKRLG